MVAAENEASAAESNARYFYLVLVNFCLTNWMPRVIYGYARSARRPSIHCYCLKFRLYMR